MLPCCTEYTVAGITLKALADLSQQTRLVTPRRKEGSVFWGAMGSRKTSHCGGERGTGGGRREGDEPTLQFDFHLSHRAPLHCTRPLGTDTTRAPGRPWQAALLVNSLAARAQVGVLSCHIKSRLVSCQGWGAAPSAQAASCRRHAKAAVGEHLSELRGQQHRWEQPCAPGNILPCRAPSSTHMKGASPTSTCLCYT